jgi:hypothetical protein
MSETMVRKQIYISRRQDALLKRLAKQRGVSEAEVIRQALDYEVEMPGVMMRNRKKGLDEIFAYVESLKTRPEFLTGEPYKWNRQELYEEREMRWFKDGKDKE